MRTSTFLLIRLVPCWNSIITSKRANENLSKRFKINKFTLLFCECDGNVTLSSKIFKIHFSDILYDYVSRSGRKMEKGGKFQSHCKSKICESDIIIYPSCVLLLYGEWLIRVEKCFLAVVHVQLSSKVKARVIVRVTSFMHNKKVYNLMIRFSQPEMNAFATRKCVFMIV